MSLRLMASAVVGAAAVVAQIVAGCTAALRLTTPSSIVAGMLR